MKSKQTFKDLDDDLQDIAVQIVEGLDYSYASAMKEWNPTDPYAYIRDNLIVPMGDLSDSDKQKLQSSFENLIKLDAGNLSQQNQAEITQLINTIASLLEKTPLEIRVALGFDVEDTKNKYNEALKEAKRQLGGYEHDDKGFEINNAVGYDLDNFWAENVVTEEDWVLWKQVTEDITDATEAMDAFTEAKKASKGIDLSSSININGVVADIDTKLKPVMNAIQNAWAGAYDDEGVFEIDPSKALDTVSEVKNAIDSINSNKDLGIHIDTSSIQELSDVLTDTASTEEDVRQAYGNIADAVMNEFIPAMNGMDDAHIKVMQSFLEGLGITNAEELIIQQIGYSYETYAAAKEAAANAGINLNNATSETYNNLFSESTMALEDEQALLDYYAAKLIANDSTIETVSDVQRLISEWEQLGLNCDKLREYRNLKGKSLEGGTFGLGSGNYEHVEMPLKPKVELPDIPKTTTASRTNAQAAKEEVNVLSDLNSEMDKLQSAYKSLCDIKDTYNKYGKITVDQYQELTNLGFNFLANLVDENGQLGLNASAFERLAQAKLEEMQIQMARNAANAINGLRTEAEAVEYLTYANENLRDAALGAAEAQLYAAQAAATGKRREAADLIVQGYEASKQLAGSVDFFFDPSAQEKRTPGKIMQTSFSTHTTRKKRSLNICSAWIRYPRRSTMNSS